jgi:hypothetical protein
MQVMVLIAKKTNANRVAFEVTEKKSKITALDKDALLLRQEIIAAYEQCHEITSSGDRNSIRQIHLNARKLATGSESEHVIEELIRYSPLFPQFTDIDPTRISPKLVLVTARSEEERIFRLCRATWSIPPNKGYGRRLRFLVIDTHHESVIGIIGLQSPPADLACRDSLLGCDKGNKLKIVNATMDAYAVGAVGAYRQILGGKLVAGLLGSDEIRQAYWNAYASKTSQMGKIRYLQPLLAVTTTSAFGRSAIYNRVKFNDRIVAERIGATKGFGTLHIEHLYPRICSFLEKYSTLVPAGFGNGPKVRWQNVQIALYLLKLNGNYLRHGLSRDVFLFRHVHNLEDVARSGAIPQPFLLSVADYSEYWRRRWAIPRASRLAYTLDNFNSVESMARCIETC